MKFLYIATTKSGSRVRGEIEAPSRQAALVMLKDKKLTITSLMKMEHSREIYLGGVSAMQKVQFTKHLAIMLKAGIGLDEALETLITQSRGQLRDALEMIRKDVESGMRLADALVKHRNIFNQYYISMVQAGEESGDLAANLEQLSERYAKDYELKVKVKSALLYPGVVLGLTVGLMMAVAIFVLPKLTLLFKSLKYQLPWYTRVMIAVSQFLANYGIISVIGLIILIVVGIWLLRRPFAAPFTHRVLLHLPIIGGIVETVNLARFSMICGSLLKSGIPITQALTTTGNVLGNVVYKQTLLAAVDRVNTGEPFSSVIEESPLFPPFTARMLIAGEQTGKLADMLIYLSDFYEHELDATLKNLSVILEPALIIGIGLIVLGVALSIIGPMYSFIGALT